MSGRNLSRRAFLARTAMAGAVLAAPLVGVLHVTGARSGPVHLVSELHGSRSARRLGRIYLDGVPSEASVDTVVTNLCGMVDRHGDACLVRVRDLIARDFHTGDVVTIDGWLISRTEARLFALSALVSF